MKHSVASVLTILLITFGFTTAVSAAEAEDLIKYRKNVMSAMGGHTGAIFAIAGDKAGDKSHLAAHINSLAATGAIVVDIFPPESADGDTRAKPEIWQQTAEFAEAVNQLEDATANLQTVFDSGDMAEMGAALKQLGGACKNCHDNFRAKQE